VRDIRRQEAPHELKLDLPAAHSAGRMARKMLRQFAINQGIPARAVETLEFVAGELIDNAVDHGGGRSAREAADLVGDVRVSLTLAVTDDRWVVRVGDQGGGEPDQVRHLLAPPDGIPDLEDERGRGFFLLVQMVDRIEVGKTRDGLGLEFQASCRFDKR